jgi:ABC-2 type transport system ATP-binding protein
MITIKNLQKSYNGKVVVDIPDFMILNGEKIGLVGNNGAGKTTLIRLILDLLKPDRGEITSGGKPVYRSDHWKTYTGAYIDTDFLIDFLTPEEYFQSIAHFSGFSESEIHVRLKKFTDFMAGEILSQNKYIRELSFGNKQKVGIIGAMLPYPEVLIIDEPFNFLDPTSQICLKEILQDYNKFKKAIIFVSSHSLQHISELCEKIILMENGKFIQVFNNQMEFIQDLNNYFKITVVR